MIERELATLSALGKLEEHLYAMTELTERLQQVPLWLPSHGLAKQAAEAHRMMARMQARMDRRLVVTLIGPSGAGKSTLLNALAGVDDLSPAGNRRPTTRGLVVLADEAEAVRQLLGPLDETRVAVRSSRAADLLSHMVLIDTPDTDSTQSDAHWPLILHAVAHSDVLICVFDAQNPKRRDHADFMAPLVRSFHGASLVAVVNQCDRLDAQELTGVIAPEFRSYLQQAWEMQPQALLMTSARRHLRQPQWDPQALPRHDLDQFEELRRMVFDTFNRPGFGQDRRLANTRQIREFMQAQVHQAVEQDRPALQKAAHHITAAEQQALRQAVESLRADDRRMLLGVNVRLYQALSQRWVGPVGWIVAIWSRLILFGTGLAALVRFGNPLHQIWGLISSWRRYKESSAALDSLADQTRVDTALQSFQQAWWTQWPDIGELLIQGRFDPKVRRMEVQDGPSVGRVARSLWTDTLDSEIERSARHLSHAALQTVFNLPSLALLGYVAWLTASRFLTGAYLSGDFFLHALLAIAVVLLLSFFIFQVFARLAISRERIQRRAFRTVERAISHHPLLAGKEVAEQVSKVLALSA
ncbi:MAG: ATP-binding cassette domain-containing protein [Desulfobacteraceae bacterium]|nr:MAG: ATP-binding cassette domain-containing protein [Desulfobacteraceae bacterium]